MAEGTQLLSVKPKTGLFKGHSFAPGSFPHQTDHLESSALLILLSSASPVGDDGALSHFLNIKAQFYSIFQQSVNVSEVFWQRVLQVHLLLFPYFVLVQWGAWLLLQPFQPGMLLLCPSLSSVGQLPLRLQPHSRLIDVRK